MEIKEKNSLAKAEKPKGFIWMFVVMVLTTAYSFIGVPVYELVKFELLKYERLIWIEIVMGELAGIISAVLLFGIYKMRNLARAIYVFLLVAVTVYMLGWSIWFATVAYKIGWDASASMLFCFWSFHIPLPAIFIWYLSLPQVREKFKSEQGNIGDFRCRNL
ncbi:MAG TPA: hypothetical protein PLL75_04695 [Candidatus Omnitrophota bacterium]|nr:hypothetical protein [Candidatus Omnitrophota bacterium]HPS37010.1 hypothetical protein [Candidatus Omnitrophota bacterium]